MCHNGNLILVLFYRLGDLQNSHPAFPNCLAEETSLLVSDRRKNAWFSCYLIVHFDGLGLHPSVHFIWRYQVIKSHVSPPSFSHETCQFSQDAPIPWDGKPAVQIQGAQLWWVEAPVTVPAVEDTIPVVWVGKGAPRHPYFCSERGKVGTQLTVWNEKCLNIPREL